MGSLLKLFVLNDDIVEFIFCHDSTEGNVVATRVPTVYCYLSLEIHLDTIVSTQDEGELLRVRSSDLTEPLNTNKVGRLRCQQVGAPVEVEIVVHLGLGRDTIEEGVVEVLTVEASDFGENGRKGGST